MPKIKLTIGRVFSYLVATEPHWPRISSVLLNFLRYSLSFFSLKIHLQNLWKPFQFVLDQNLCHFEANLFDRAEIFDLEMPLEDGETQPNYPRPPCATSFFKSGLIRILHQYFTHSLYVYAGETIMPPRAKTLRGQKPRPSPLTFLSHVVQACTQRILPTREGSRRGTGNDTLIGHVMGLLW